MSEAIHYIESLYGDDMQLEKIKQAIIDHGMPSISINPGYGRFLTMLVRISRAKRILEIGALGGLSGICLARGLQEDGQLLSLELQESYAQLAKQHLTEAGYGDKVSYMIGDAKDSLHSLAEQGETFDFFFIDADKGSYADYLDYSIKLARPGAIIAADNTLLKGKVYNVNAQGASAQAVRLFNERMATDDRLVSAILPAYDGISLAMVK